MLGLQLPSASDTKWTPQSQNATPHLEGKRSAIGILFHKRNLSLTCDVSIVNFSSVCILVGFLESSSSVRVLTDCLSYFSLSRLPHLWINMGINIFCCLEMVMRGTTKSMLELITQVTYGGVVVVGDRQLCSVCACLALSMFFTYS